MRPLLPSPSNERLRIGARLRAGRQAQGMTMEQLAHVLSGAITVTFENETRALAAGDTVTFSGREPHTWRNASEGPSEVLWVIAPAPWSGSYSPRHAGS
jgi:glyoxylate utilization-related uncharacterized protein